MSATNLTRAAKAFDLRVEQAAAQKSLPLPGHPNNHDEDALPHRIGSFSKGLPHNELGEVDNDAYDAMLMALSSHQPTDFEAIPMGESDLAKRRKLVNPQGGLAFDLAGADSQHLFLRPPPRFDSPEAAGEMVENYWMALTRDIAFTNYETSPLVQNAIDDLNKLSDFRGPKVNGKVTPRTLFRGFAPGDLVGPYISQLLFKAAKFGADIIEQRFQTTTPGKDFLTKYDEWLAAQRGTTTSLNTFDPVTRYIRNGRDSGQYVHIDVLFQAYFDACLILAAPVDPADPLRSGFGVPLNPGNPYVSSQNQEGFATFGPPHIKGILGEVSVRALKAVWFQKWFVHRRLRPEVFAGRVHNHKMSGATYPIHDDVLKSDALKAVFAANKQRDLSGKRGTYLLPMAFTEGSPLHPSYGSGHATVAGACVTILKWFFDGSFVLKNPVVPNHAAGDTDGTKLVPYTGSDKDQLTVEGELNKVASNIGISRNISGVHWRSDYAESLRLGEEVALRTLMDFRATVNEQFDGCTFNKFDGTPVTI